VLLDLVAQDNANKSFAACTADEIRGVVAGVDPGSPLREILDTWVTEGEDVADVLKRRLAGWFDEGMTRISGWYGRQAKLIIVLIAVAVTVSTNASSIQLVERLWDDEALRTTIAEHAVATAGDSASSDEIDDAYDQLKQFPIGWSTPPCGLVDWLKTILGWLITIAAISLGAPFWFDLLGKVANLKGTGGKAKQGDG
jgi:hypothetical protein